VHHSKFGGRRLSWVMSVELVPFATFPLYPPSRRKADIVEPPLRASSGREQLQRGNPLFDHDVGAQQEGFRDLQPDRLCRLEVDDQLEFRGLLNWNVFGMLAL
jgi:hypothetical protein